jgi:signal transduction histidine kinase
MAEPFTPRAGDAFAEETRHVVARRAGLGLGFVLGLATVAGLLELAYYPERLGKLAAAFATEVVLCAAALLAIRGARLRRFVLPITSAAAFGIVLCMTLYAAWAGASRDALAIALVLALSGVALLCPWGARAQVPLALGTLAIYLLALAGGLRGGLPLPYGILCVGGGAVTSVLGAIFLDLHRRAIFHQRVLLERRRDEQLATLYDVTRTVAATLELPDVLRLVCQNMLHALGVERLWLFWREAPEGALRALAAEWRQDQVALTDLRGDPERWEPLLDAGASRVPALLEPRGEERAALGDSGPLPAHLLRLPLEFRSELVGLVLADAGGRRGAAEASFLDFAATLGNSAAMAIANARLYALVREHRAELQRLSNKRLDVVEEGMRRMSRELHDGTCQALMAITLDLALLDRRLPAEAAALHGVVRDIRDQVLDVMHSVRQMSHLLHSPVLDDFGAVAAMESIAEKHRETSGLAVRVDCSDPGMRFAPAVELLLFRAFQEGLANVVKHAAASRVDVRLTCEPGAVTLEIEDDGRGFDAPAYFRTPSPSRGLGLASMRERVAHFDGALRVSSQPGSGTRIVVRVPVEPLVKTKAATAS